MRNRHAALCVCTLCDIVLLRQEHRGHPVQDRREKDKPRIRVREIGRQDVGGIHEEGAAVWLLRGFRRRHAGNRRRHYPCAGLAGNGHRQDHRICEFCAPDPLLGLHLGHNRLPLLVLRLLHHGPLLLCPKLLRLLLHQKYPFLYTAFITTIKDKYQLEGMIFLLLVLVMVMSLVFLLPYSFFKMFDDPEEFFEFGHFC